MEEPIVVGEGGPYPLQGILSMPETAQEGTGTGVPAVVLVQGSGSSDRDETIFGNKPFRDIAEYLSAQGIAVLRHDKRTFVYGRKMLRALKGELDIEVEMIEDALLATALVRSDPRIDPDRVYLLGHSLGGMMAPRIDAEGGDYAGLIIMAGSPYSLDDIIMRQNDELQKTAGPILRFIMKWQVGKIQKAFSAMPTMSEEEAKKTKALGGVYVWYFKDMEDHPIEEYADKLEKPLLFLQGEKDFQVLPHVDFAGYQRLFSSKAQATFKLYPGLNHLFMKSTYGLMKDFRKEYKIPAKVDQAVLRDIAAWIHAGGTLA